MYRSRQIYLQPIGIFVIIQMKQILLGGGEHSYDTGKINVLFPTPDPIPKLCQAPGRDQQAEKPRLCIK
jgi:hypothetical protein